jgi:oxygen-dependent protoporphyrinogen oxidase
MEGGPDSFLTSKPWALDLCRELGLEKDLVPLEPKNRKSYLFHRDEFHALPEGLAFGIPTRLWPLFRLSLISWSGKLRMAMETLQPRRRDDPNESLGAFLRRRFGREAVELLMEPLLAGVFHAPIDRLCLRSTFPRFQDLERVHRSLILGMRKMARPASSPLLTLRNGMAQLVERTMSASERVEFRSGVNVRGVQASGRIDTEQGSEHADAVILAIPAHQAAALLSESNPTMAEGLKKIPSASAATVSLGFRAPSLPMALDGTGFVLGRSRRRRMTACTWSSRKFPGRAPEHHLLVRCYLNETGHSADELVRIAREELRDTMRLEDTPVVSAVYPWPDRLPVLEVGHARRVQEIERSRRLTPRLYMSGSGFPGTGIPDCIHQGKITAEQVSER